MLNKTPYLKRIILFIATVFFGFTNVFAQEDPVANQYYFNYYLANPAVAGATDCTYFMFTNSFNWVGLDADAPMTQTLSFQTRLQNSMGIGAYIFNDRNGYSLQQGAQFTLAYHIDLSDGRRYMRQQVRRDRQLSFGVSGKVFNRGYSSDFNPDPTNPAYQDMSDSQVFNANVGAYFTSYGFFTGLSAFNLVPTKMSASNVDLEPIIPLTFELLLGNEFELNHKESLEPSLMYKFSADEAMDLDLNLKYSKEFNKNRDNAWWVQATFRGVLDPNHVQTNKLIGMVGFKLNKFYLAYAYGADLNRLIRYSYATHQIMLGYTFCHVDKFCR